MEFEPAAGLQRCPAVLAWPCRREQDALRGEVREALQCAEQAAAAARKAQSEAAAAAKTLRVGAFGYPQCRLSSLHHSCCRGMGWLAGRGSAVLACAAQSCAKRPSGV